MCSNQTQHFTGDITILLLADYIGHDMKLCNVTGYTFFREVKRKKTWRSRAQEQLLDYKPYHDTVLYILIPSYGRQQLCKTLLTDQQRPQNEQKQEEVASEEDCVQPCRDGHTGRSVRGKQIPEPHSQSEHLVTRERGQQRSGDVVSEQESQGQSCWDRYIGLGVWLGLNTGPSNANGPSNRSTV